MSRRLWTMDKTDLSRVTDSLTHTDLNTTSDGLDTTALCQALKDGNVERTKCLLLESDIIPARQYTDILSSIMIELVSGGRRDLLKLFLVHGPNPHSNGLIQWRGSVHSCCALKHAICTDQPEILKDILDVEANPGRLVTETVVVYDLQTDLVLHTACMLRARRCFNLLTQLPHKDSKLEECNFRGQMPLHVAAEYNPEFIPKLVELGSNINFKQTDGMTPLMLTAAHHPSHIPVLLQHGAEATIQGNHRQTALHELSGYSWMCRQWQPSLDYVNLAKQLLQAGLSVHDTSSHGFSALSLLMTHVERLARYLADFTPDINMNEGDDLCFHDEKTFAVSCTVYLDAIKYIVGLTSTSDIQNALPDAIRFLTKMLDEAPADMSEKMPYYITYFQLQRDIFHALLERDADPNMYQHKYHQKQYGTDQSRASSTRLDRLLLSFNSLSPANYPSICKILLDIFTQLVWHGARLSDGTAVKVMPALIAAYMNCEDIHFAPKLVSVYFDSLSYQEAHYLLNKMCTEASDRLPPSRHNDKQHSRFCDYILSFKSNVTLKGLTKDVIMCNCGGMKQLARKVNQLPLPPILQLYLATSGH